MTACSACARFQAPAQLANSVKALGALRGIDEDASASNTEATGVRWSAQRLHLVSSAPLQALPAGPPDGQIQVSETGRKSGAGRTLRVSPRSPAITTIAPVAEPTRTTERTATARKTKGTRQGFFCIWHGLSYPGFRQLLALNPNLTREHWFRLRSIQALALSNSFWNGIEDLVYGRRVEATQITKPPIFILGHWRSGTTLLHNLLTLDPQFTFPNLYHTMFPGHFLTTEAVVSTVSAPLVPKTRPMDNVKTGWKLPQEDEVALCNMTLLSPYLMTIFQGDRSKYGRFFDVRDMTADQQKTWKSAFVTFLKKLTFKNDRPIILKSPSHTYRIATLLELFPDAKFVYIYRDPYAVYQSSLHLRRTMFSENALGPINFTNYEEDTLQTLEHALDTYEETKHLVPPKNLCEMRFEDLEANPVGELKRTYESLGFAGWDRMQPRVEGELPGIQSYRKNSFSMDAGEMQIVYGRLKKYFDLYGYDSRQADA